MQLYNYDEVVLLPNIMQSWVDVHTTIDPHVNTQPVLFLVKDNMTFMARFNDFYSLCELTGHGF